jgi:hypothetical protein
MNCNVPGSNGFLHMTRQSPRPVVLSISHIKHVEAGNLGPRACPDMIRSSSTIRGCMNGRSGPHHRLFTFPVQIADGGCRRFHQTQ